MRTNSPLLLPLFRSSGQARLLARVFLDDRAATINRVARELEIDPGVVSREADRLERAGLLRSERSGNQRVIRPNEDSPYFVDLRNLLTKAFGPVDLVTRALAEIDGIDRAYVYGSWAARHLGEHGDAPNDIDLLIVGSPNRRQLAHLTRELSREFGQDVHPTIVPTAEWQAKSTGFLRSVAAGPLVELPRS
jgi:predicted nucleotidyltransferase